VADIKFCGLTTAEDAALAGALGARYAGVVFAGGPRAVDPERAADVLDAAGPAVTRVGVFGAADPSTLARIVTAARLQIVQLHGDPRPDDVRRAREVSGVAIWAVIRIGAAVDLPSFAPLEAVADGLVFDTLRSGVLGGTGRAFDWPALARAASGWQRRVPWIIAGGLTPQNVAAAIAAVDPDVVDVSSGVERVPGRKDGERMRSFVDAVRSAQRATRPA